MYGYPAKEAPLLFTIASKKGTDVDGVTGGEWIVIPLLNGAKGYIHDPHFVQYALDNTRIELKRLTGLRGYMNNSGSSMDVYGYPAEDAPVLFKLDPNKGMPANGVTQDGWVGGPLNGGGSYYIYDPQFVQNMLSGSGAR